MAVPPNIVVQQGSRETNQSLVDGSRCTPRTRRQLILLLATTLLVASCLLSGFNTIGSFEASSRDLREKNLEASIEKILVGASTTMLVGIFSMTSEKAARRRQLIRDTWIKKGGSRVCPLTEYIRQSKRSPNKRECKVAYAFIIGGGDDSRPRDHLDDQEPLTLPSDINGHVEDDCRYLNIRENMEGGKTPTYLKWAYSASELHGLDYVSKIDDDSVMWTPLLLDFIEQELPPAPYNKRIYGGHLVNSNKKLYQHPSRIQSHLYAEGQFYWMSSDLAGYITHELPLRKRFEISLHIEDLDVGSFIASHPYPIKYVNNARFMFWAHPRKEEEEFKASWAHALRQRNGGLPTQTFMIQPWDHFCKHYVDF